VGTNEVFLGANSKSEPWYYFLFIVLLVLDKHSIYRNNLFL